MAMGYQILKPMYWHIKEMKIKGFIALVILNVWNKLNFNEGLLYEMLKGLMSFHSMVVGPSKSFE